MLVGVVTTSYPREPGDPAGSFVAAHVDWFVGRGFRVEVICAGQPGRLHTQWQSGVRIHSIPAGSGLFYDAGAPDVLEWRGINTRNPLPFVERAASPNTTSALHSAEWPSPRKTMNTMHFLRSALDSLSFLDRWRKAIWFSTVMHRIVRQRRRRWDAAVAHWLVPGGLALGLQRGFGRHGSPRGGTHLPPGRRVAIAHSGDIHLIVRLGLGALVVRALMKSNIRIVFVSNALRQRLLQQVPPALQDWLRHQSIVCPMGIDVAHFARLSRTSRPPRQPLTLLFLGRLVPIKGVATLLRAVERLQRQRDAPLDLIIAGDGPCRSQLEQLASSLACPRTRIRFVGEVRGETRDALYRRADLLLLPSIPRPGGRTEGMPVTALEAMAANIPVIASRTGGLAELPAGAATLVAPEDPVALAHAVLRHEQTPELRRRQVAAASEHVATLDWDRVGDRIWAGSTGPTI